MLSLREITKLTASSKNTIRGELIRHDIALRAKDFERYDRLEK